MKFNIYLLIFLFVLCLASNELSAQGCVAVRQMGGNNVCSTNSYNLPKGEFQIGTGYRYFHSWRHFVGTEEQPYRQNTQGGFDANGKERGNAVNIYSHAIDLNISYAITDRIQFNISIPYVNNERSQVLKISTEGTINIDGQDVPHTKEAQRYSVYAQGLGDIRVSTSYWIFDPAKTAKGNLMVGAGLKLNNGSYTEKDNGLFLDPKSKHGDTPFDSLVTMDQAIQPGDGGIGFSVELQGFRQLVKNVYGFVNGYYLFNPRESNGTFKSKPTVVKDPDGNTLATLTGYNIYASPDQYFARAGVMTSFLKEKTLTVSLAGRMEGIPAYDVFGGQVAYRRPGYVVAVEPGISYRIGKHNFSLLVPYNVVKNRIQSAADLESQKIQNAAISNESEKVHVQGDAAFADYSINFNYTYRLGKLF